jgi:hypothetical protein
MLVRMLYKSKTGLQTGEKLLRGLSGTKRVAIQKAQWPMPGTNEVKFGKLGWSQKVENKRLHKQYKQ